MSCLPVVATLKKLTGLWLRRGGAIFFFLSPGDMATINWKRGVMSWGLFRATLLATRSQRRMAAD